MRQVRQVRHPVVSSADYDDAEFRARSVPVSQMVLVSLILSNTSRVPVVSSWGAMRLRLDDGPVRFPGQAFGATTLSVATSVSSSSDSEAVPVHDTGNPGIQIPMNSSLIQASPESCVSEGLKAPGRWVSGLARGCPSRTGREQGGEGRQDLARNPLLHQQ